MALKFLNKKGWHTGSLRNIENVWKAEQKRDAEDKKLEELRKQIHEERERAEFRQLQEQAGLISSQERLEFLYDSGLAVGKGGSSFKALESLPKTEPEATASSSTPAAKPEASALGALFEDKPQSANDAWRKLHSDPLLLIRQREQEALARIKNNPVKMSMIRKSVETKKNKDKDEKKHRKKHQKKKSKHRTHSSSETDSDHEDATLSVEKQRESRHKSSRSDKPSSKRAHTSDDESSEEDTRRKKYYDKECKDRRSGDATNPKYDKSDEHKSRKSDYDSQRKEYFSERPGESRSDKLSSKRAHASDEESSEEDTRRKKYHDKEYKDRRPSGAPNPKYDKSDDQHKTRKSDYESQRREYSSERPGESRPDKLSSMRALTSDEELGEEDTRRKKYYDKEYRDRRPSGAPNPKYDKSDDQHKTRKSDYESQRREYSSERQDEPSHDKRRNSNTSGKPPRHDSNNRGRNPVKLSEEERAAKLREMQMDAEIHEEQRWKRLKKAADSEAQEAISDRASGGKNFLDATQKSIYGAEKGGSSTIEESVRRRAYYSQRGLASDGNAFRRS